MVPEAEKVCDFESDNKENEFDNEPEHLDALERYELKKKEKEEQAQKKIYADLAQERQLIASMNVTRAATKNEAIFIERIQGVGTVGDSQAELTLTFNETTIKPRPDESLQNGFIVYGRNLNPDRFRAVMSAFRKQVSSVTLVEIQDAYKTS